MMGVGRVVDGDGGEDGRRKDGVEPSVAGDGGGEGEIGIRGSGVSVSADERDVSYVIVASVVCRNIIVKSSNNSWNFDGLLAGEFIICIIDHEYSSSCYSQTPTKSSTMLLPSG